MEYSVEGLCSVWCLPKASISMRYILSPLTMMLSGDMCIPFGKYRVGQGVEGSAETLIVTIVVEKNIRQGLALNPLGKGDIYIYGVTRY